MILLLLNTTMLRKGFPTTGYLLNSTIILYTSHYKVMFFMLCWMLSNRSNAIQKSNCSQTFTKKSPSLDWTVTKIPKQLVPLFTISLTSIKPSSYQCCFQQKWLSYKQHKNFGVNFLEDAITLNFSHSLCYCCC